MRLTVRVCAFVITIFACFSAVDVVVAQVAPVQAGQVIISELRFRGPDGIEDEFIELYNNTDSPITVQAVDASPGWAVAISNGQITGNVCLVPNGTVIPARGHFLCANTNGYSLHAYPAGNAGCGAQNGQLLAPQFGPSTPDASWDFDVPDGSGVALFTTTATLAQTAATRLDAFGFTTSPALFREGAGFPTIPNSNTEHTLYRSLSPTITPKDTNDNAADFLFVATTGSIQTQLNGSPGPENKCSPIVNNTTIVVSMLDPAVSPNSVPNRERVLTPETNAPLGSLLVRRKYTNNTGLSVTRLRFRTNLLTTRGSCPSPCADLRLLTSADEPSVGTSQGPVFVNGLTLEENPPLTPEGGGMNSTVSANSVHLAQPLAPGASINVVFKLGIVRGGTFQYYISIEALSGAVIAR